MLFLTFEANKNTFSRVLAHCDRASFFYLKPSYICRFILYQHSKTTLSLRDDIILSTKKRGKKGLFCGEPQYTQARRPCQPPAEHFWCVCSSYFSPPDDPTHASLSPKQGSLLPVVIVHSTTSIPVDVLGGGLKFPPGKRLRLQIVAVDSVESQHHSAEPV